MKIVDLAPNEPTPRESSATSNGPASTDAPPAYSTEPWFAAMVDRDDRIARGECNHGTSRGWELATMNRLRFCRACYERAPVELCPCGGDRLAGARYCGRCEVETQRLRHQLRQGRPDHFLGAEPEMLDADQRIALEGRLILGPAGAGKSFACATLVAAFADQLREFGWIESRDLVASFDRGAGYDPNLAAERWSRLVLDDLGRGSPLASWQADGLCSWLDALRPGVKLWVTSNRSPEELERQIGSPAMSRLYGRVGGLRGERHLEGRDRRRE